MLSAKLATGTSLAPPRHQQAPADGAAAGCAAVVVEKVAGTAWDRLAAGFDDAVHDQTGCFNVARWGAERTETIVFRQHGAVIGGAAVVVFAFPVLRSGLAIVKWGPLWRMRGHDCSPARLTAMLAVLQQEYAVRRGMALTVMPLGEPGGDQPVVESLEALGFRAGNPLPAPKRYLVNTATTADDLFAGLAQKWRYNLRKALGNDLEIGFADTAAGREQFTALYCAMLARKKFHDTSAIHTLDDLLETGVEAFRPRIVLAAHGGSVTAGAIVDMSGERAVYLYGATDDRALKLKAGYALHWWIARHLCDATRCRWYDLGGTECQDGLQQFKKGFVGRTGAILALPPAYHYSATATAGLLGRSVFGLQELRTRLSRILHAARERLGR